MRNQNSAEKLVKYIESSEGVTFEEADFLSGSGVKGVVDQVREGMLPVFQHVYASGWLPITLTSLGSLLKFQSSWWRVYYNSPPGDHHQPASLQI